MKYKIIHKGKSPHGGAAKRLRRGANKRACADCGGKSLPIMATAGLPNTQKRDSPPSDVSDLFGFGGFYDPYSDTEGKGSAGSAAHHRKTARMRALVWRLKMWTERQRETIVSKIDAARERRNARRRRASTTPMLFGALCAILCVFALSVTFIGYRLLLKDRVLRFSRVEIPELVGQNSEDILLDEELFAVAVNYEHDGGTPEGTVIEQTPSAGAIRRVYRGGEPCKITLTVSLGERRLVMRDYVSRSAREALLELKNEAVKFEISEKYSDTVEAGCVISTTPEAGDNFTASDVVTLTLSLGKERKFAAIPDLSGLTEVRAREALEALGFAVGEIRYVPSRQAIGTVTSQSSPAYSLIELGARVDLEVSAGMGFSEKKVPDLYGLTVDEARARLAEVGLVCGSVFNVQGGTGILTVVSQSIAAGTPITSGIISVDIYVSS